MTLSPPHQKGKGSPPGCRPWLPCWSDSWRSVCAGTLEIWKETAQVFKMGVLQFCSPKPHAWCKEGTQQMISHLLIVSSDFGSGKCLKVYFVTHWHLHLNSTGFHERHITLIYQSSNLRWIARDIFVLLSDKKSLMFTALPKPVLKSQNQDLVRRNNHARWANLHQGRRASWDRDKTRSFLLW